MIKSARVAAMAVAVIGLTVSFVAGEPLQAGEAKTAPVSSHYTDHADAAAFSDLGSNDAETSSAVAERMTQLAEAAVPRPRTLGEQVTAYKRTATADAEQDCLASAVYFEARGEPIQGQLAVAEVVLNRVASKQYPDTVCEVVEQPWQFSFVNATGRIPEANRSSEAWQKAVAIARIAQIEAAREVSKDVLWYHADYVSPSWGRRLNREEKVGLHIFYS